MNIALYYFGASGGFYALWHILIGTEYRCKFSIDIEEITDIYKHHWDITEKPKWKATEIHPNNNLTKQSDIGKKVFYYCGITEFNWQQHANDYRIILYTDLDLQILLAKNKNAWIFYNGAKPTQERIKQIKDTSTCLNGTQVLGEITKFAKADLYVKLQDLVNPSGGAILEPLGYTVTQKNRKHNELWLSLHNNEERKRLVNHPLT